MTEGKRPRPVTEPDLDRLDEMFADPEAIGLFTWGGFADGSVCVSGGRRTGCSAATRAC